MKNLLPVIRHQKHKASARTQARTHVIATLNVLVDLKYNFECDWPIELSDNKLSKNKVSNNKLSDNNLASELVENRSVFKPITIEEIVIFMINGVIIYMKKLLDSDRLRTVQFECNTGAKSVTPVQILDNDLLKEKRNFLSQ